MIKRKQGDITPVWKLVIWEDIEESAQLATKHIKGDFAKAIEEADKLLQSYKDMSDIFKVSHFTIE